MYGEVPVKWYEKTLVVALLVEVAVLWSSAAQARPLVDLFWWLFRQ